jgi:hypothetical protein
MSGATAGACEFCQFGSNKGRLHVRSLDQAVARVEAQEDKARERGRTLVDLERDAVGYTSRGDTRGGDLVVVDEVVAGLLARCCDAKGGRGPLRSLVAAILEGEGVEASKTERFEGIKLSAVGSLVRGAGRGAVEDGQSRVSLVVVGRWVSRGERWAGGGRE